MQARQFLCHCLYAGASWYSLLQECFKIPVTSWVHLELNGLPIEYWLLVSKKQEQDKNLGSFTSQYHAIWLPSFWLSASTKIKYPLLLLQGLLHSSFALSILRGLLILFGFHKTVNQPLIIFCYCSMRVLPFFPAWASMCSRCNLMPSRQPLLVCVEAKPFCAQVVDKEVFKIPA